MKGNNKRLFGKSSIKLDESIVIKLICKIKGTVIKKTTCNQTLIDGNILAGYTYIGQMIAHDIVNSTGNSKIKASPILNLSSIYDKKHYKTFRYDDEGRFVLGYTIDSDGTCFPKTDLLRVNGVAQIPESRNDENLIISQMHLLWQRLHNSIIDSSSFKTKKNNKLKAIKKTRRCVNYIFNKIIQDDYLEKLLHADVFKLYKKNKFQTILYKTGDHLYHIPYEFSHAAFRFGHSMIRETYNLNGVSQSVCFKKLFLRDPCYIEKKNVINWSFFFNYNPLNSQTIVIPQAAKIIDTHITREMYEIPMPDKKHDIRDLNLIANLDLDKKIKFGKEVFDELIQFNQFKNLLNCLSLKEIYKKLNGSAIDLPLWAYELLEAEEFSNKASTDDINFGSLGIVGSILVVEVLLKSINTANKRISDKDCGEIESFITSDLSDSDGILTMKNILTFLEKQEK